MSSVVDIAKARARHSARGGGALEDADLSYRVADTSAKPPPDRVAYYEEQAAKVRAEAAVMKNNDTRSAMLRLADVWDTLAKKARSHTLHGKSQGNTSRASA
ncbi:MAG: hypothetical protein JOY64_00655 [Alphaproteobacteria bacterium]|nr:hypothetical protein [Alphaproteobacteria bacterium]MBV8406113.1 hypothetical protein [Alphaproteobacteria bacterium]